MESLPDPQNVTDLLLQSFYRSRSQGLGSIKSKIRKEVMCQKCLTPWSAGKFTIKMISSHHHRKRRRLHLIERYRQSLKQANNKKETIKLKNMIHKLQKLNHIARYHCQICHETTKIQLWKPSIMTKEKDAIAPMLERPQEAKVKKIKTKKKKTAGLNIPSQNSIITKSSTTNKLQLSKVAKMFQQSTAIKSQSKLNQFLS